jgi:uncharacterized membrane protein
MLIGLVLMITFWAVLVWAIWYFVTKFSQHPERTHIDDANCGLDERLARGEIDDEEYRELRDVMRGDCLLARKTDFSGVG